MAENPILNDRYRLIEQIGSGGMAVLYKAQDLDLERTVAVKVLRPSLVGDPEFLIRFRREARAAANLSHPNIVTVHDVGQDGPKTHYIVMEYVPGQNLKQLIRAKGAFEVDASLAVIVEVCKGVGYAHRAGLVHCDVKPQNILVTPDNSIKVVDFGIARALVGAQAEEVDDMIWGSPHYFSPEQAVGDPPTPASDVYSIGVVLFEMLTGKLPFTGSDYRELAMAHLRQEPPSILDINSMLPAELDRIIRKVLSKEPAARYRTADQMGRILKKYLDEGQQTTSSFIVRPSIPQGQQAAPAPQRSQHREERPSSRPPGLTQEPVGQATVPTLPPIEPQYTPIPTPSRAPRPAPYTPAPPGGYPQPEPEEVPEFDIYGIMLGVLAAIAVLGLIPLWITVYMTLTR